MPIATSSVVSSLLLAIWICSVLLLRRGGGEATEEEEDVDDEILGPPEGPSLRIVGVPDAHGDPQALTEALRLAGVLVPRNATSAADGGAHVISLGDSVDRGPDAQGCYKVLEDINATRLLGNHEWINLMGVDEEDDPSTLNREDLFKDYVTKDDLSMFGGWAKRRHAFSRHGKLGRSIRRNFELMAMLPSRWARADKLPPKHAAATLFMHAGITFRLASKYGSVATMASTGRQHLQRSLRGDDAGFMSDLFREVLQDRHLTGYGVCRELRKTLKLLGAARLVLGHTPQESRRAEVKCDGRLIFLDVAMSRWLMDIDNPEPTPHPVALELVYSGATGEEMLSSMKLLYPDRAVNVAPFVGNSREL
mmetsp:Transcript_11932/g.21845  ORF Transcript_11932/g.21845 Transcript_11932/m.21845 type:complete len:365 (+) Transcript_11932:115-1209(+)